MDLFIWHFIGFEIHLSTCLINCAYSGNPNLWYYNGQPWQKALCSQKGGLLCWNQRQAAGHSDHSDHSDHSAFDETHSVPLIFISYYGNKTYLDFMAQIHSACSTTLTRIALILLAVITSWDTHGAWYQEMDSSYAQSWLPQKKWPTVNQSTHWQIITS